MTTPAISETPLFDTCHCEEEELQIMRDLVARGVPQYDATLIAFGHPPRPTAPMEVQRYWIRLHVRQLGNQARAELGLDPLAATVDATSPLPIGVRLVRAANTLSKAFRRMGRSFDEAAQKVHRAFAHLGEDQ